MPQTDEGVARKQLDPEAVRRLNRVTQETGAVICVSSTWRLGDEGQWERTQWMLRCRGVVGRIIDRTPNLFREVPSGLLLSEARRGTEIDAWLKGHPEVSRFAIVDDDGDMFPHMDRLVQTSFETGLLDDHVERLVQMLGRGP